MYYLLLFSTARDNGVLPQASCTSTHAPASSNARQHSRRPKNDAWCNGKQPNLKVHEKQPLRWLSNFTGGLVTKHGIASHYACVNNGDVVVPKFCDNSFFSVNFVKTSKIKNSHKLLYTVAYQIFKFVFCLQGVLYNNIIYIVEENTQAKLNIYIPSTNLIM